MQGAVGWAQQAHFPTFSQTTTTPLPQPFRLPSPNIFWSMFFLATAVIVVAAARRAATPDLLTAARDHSDWWG